jgi:hypothetical protein
MSVRPSHCEILHVPEFKMLARFCGDAVGCMICCATNPLGSTIFTGSPSTYMIAIGDRQKAQGRHDLLDAKIEEKT